ncbi:MAG: hypothetical protein AB7H80_03265 [Candidatus Kapaibacterium sp.]
MPDRRENLSIIPGLLVSLGLLPLLWLGDLREQALTYAILALTTTLLLYGGIFLIRRHQIPIRPHDLLLVALLLRALTFPLQPSLSDDAWRYLWDGRLLLNGFNPYHHIPADTALAELHDQLFALQGYPETNTIYPPVAQTVFATSMAIAEPFGDHPLIGFYIWKVFLIAAEMFAIWLLLLLLKRWRIPLYGAALYAWHPLVLVEIAGQGHTDGLWVLALGIALVGFALGRRSGSLAGDSSTKEKSLSIAGGGGLAGLGFGIGARLFPLVIFPLWLRFLDRRRAVLGIILALPFILTLALFLDPEAFSRYTTVAARFTNYYEFNGGIYRGIKWILDEFHLKPSNQIAGRIVTGAMLLGIATITLWPLKRRTLSALLGRVIGIITLQIALTAKVHIWYFVAPLFLLAVTNNRRFSLLWYWAALVAPLTYLYYAVNPNFEQPWVLWLEWGGMGVLYLVGEVWERSLRMRN